MKMEKVIIGFVLSLFLPGLLSLCAIDRKCPAYSRATTEAKLRNVHMKSFEYFFL